MSAPLSTQRNRKEYRHGPSAARTGYTDGVGAAAPSVAAQPGQGVGNDAPDPALPWTDLPEAARLLADLAANPAPQRYVRGILGPNDGELQFDDERVKALNAIWRAERDRLFEVARRTDRYSDFAAHCRLSVQVAISEHQAALADPEQSQQEMEQSRCAA